MDVRLDAQAAAVFKKVSKIYHVGLCSRRVVALDEVSLIVGWGEVFGLIGPNRAGKTTLVKALSIDLPPHGRPHHAARISALAAWHAVPSGLRTRKPRLPAIPDRAATGRRLRPSVRRLGRELRDRAGELIQRVGLADRSRETIANFSKGMLQRLALAQALVNDPRLLVLDEPAEGMDLPARRLLDEVIRERRAAGHSVILVSHALSDVKRLCDRVAVLRAGRVAYEGTIAGLAGEGTAMDEDNGPLESAVEALYAGATR